MKKYKFNGNQFILTTPISCDFAEDGTPYLFAYAAQEGEPEGRYMLFWELDWENCTMDKNTMIYAYDLAKVRQQQPCSIKKI